MRNPQLALALIAALASAAAFADAPTVKTVSGPVAGVTAGSADKFLGLPFAAPPVGPLRWKAPQSPAAWTSPRDASKHATRCSAPSAGDGPRLINEDCLYLDVYRPAGTAAGAKLPVTIFIHGGGNFSGSTDIYDGARMAAEGQTIVVTPAYRLGAFGFFAHSALTKEDDAASGDYGLLDQIKALNWVHDNIEAFGGDPGNVLLTGESSGGTAVCSVLASPSANGLYTRIGVQSGVCQVNPDLASAEKAGADFAGKLGCTDPATAADCLRGKPADAVLDAWPSGVFGAAYGTKTLPQAPMTALAAGDFPHVPALIGFNRNEMFGFMHGMYPLSEKAYEDLVKGKYGAQADELLDRYAASKYPHVEYAFGGIQGDSFMVCHAFKLADDISKYAPVSMYEFADMTAPNWKSLGDAQKTPPGYRTGAAHTSELPYLLNYAALDGPLDADQLKLASTMIHMWLDFGTDAGKAEWPRYSAEDRKVVELQQPPAGGITVSTAPYKAHNCDFWNKGS